MSAETNREVVRRFFEQASIGTLEGLDAVVDPDIQFHSSFAGEVVGRDGFRQVLLGLLTAFPDHHVSIEDMLVDGDKVTVRHTHHGTHQGPFGAIPPTGKTIAVPGIEILRVKAGRIVEFWHLDDFLGLLQQLGVVPSLAEPAAAG